MGYRWKPNKAQREAYKKRMQEKESLSTYTTAFAIRKGCFVKYYNLNRGCIVEGLVTSSSYGDDRGQHTFTIDGVMVKGQNLYPSII